MQAGVEPAVVGLVRSGGAVTHAGGQMTGVVLVQLSPRRLLGGADLQDLAQGQSVVKISSGLFGGAAGGGLLQLGQKVVDEGAAVTAAARLHVAALLEGPDGFPQGHPADAEAVGEIAFG